ncbi:MAG: SoxR reducing system RseC family protein [Candidatus Muiribacteriota bacterium]
MNKVVLKTGIVRKVNPDNDYVTVSPLTKIESEIEVKSKWPLNRGDIVKYAYFTPKLYFHKFLINIVPFIDFIFFYLLSHYLILYHFNNYIEYIQIINFVAGFLGFLSSKSAVIYFDQKTSLLDEYKPVILAVMKKKEEHKKSDS